jgi:hypothetical protein
MATFVLEDDAKRVRRTFSEHVRRFDYLGAVGSSLSLVLILIAMIQGVVADPVLSQPGSLAGLVIGGCVAGAIFVVDQFYAVDPLIPPSIFSNRIYSLTTFGGTVMAFVRNSVTYNMIFFLQGPLAKDPLQAGIDLIPYGVGIMVSGFAAGALADRFGIRNMAVAGPLIALAGAACLSAMNEHTSNAYVGGILFLTGFGVGAFQSPNSTANMLSVEAGRRGVATAVSMLTMTFCMMIGIVLTFSFVLHSMSQEQLFAVFINGGAAATNTTGAAGTAAGGIPVQACLDALAKDYYIVIAACLSASIAAAMLPADLHASLNHGARHNSAAAGPAAADANADAAEDSEKPPSTISGAAGADSGPAGEPAAQLKTPDGPGAAGADANGHGRGANGHANGSNDYPYGHHWHNSADGCTGTSGHLNGAGGPAGPSGASATVGFPAAANAAADPPAGGPGPAPVAAPSELRGSA